MYWYYYKLIGIMIFQTKVELSEFLNVTRATIDRMIDRKEILAIYTTNRWKKKRVWYAQPLQLIKELCQ